MTVISFGARFDAALRSRGSLCVGIDPHAALLRDWGLPDDVSGLQRFAATCVEAFAGAVAVLKPQSAFFERFGSDGVAVLEWTVQAARAAGALVLLDVKRGDIGSTMAAYADAYLSPASPLFSDAITVSPFLGVGSLQPAFDLAATNGAGVFVLAHTSNPERTDVQAATNAAGRTVSGVVVDQVAARNAGAHPVGSFGIVFGATADEHDLDLSALNGPILAPGVGAQGGNADSVRKIFDGVLPNVLPSVSREVLRAGPDVTALRAAAERQVAEFAFLRG